MSTIALDPGAEGSLRFYQGSIGKKVVMAVTGVILFGYIIGHLIGNLQVFAGNPAQINRYAEFLHSNPRLLWVIRAFLLGALGLHILSSVQLWLLKRKARPIGYHKKADPAATYASRTMIWSGPIIAAFVIFHILHLTAGEVLPLSPTDVYQNVVNGFKIPAVAISYIVAVSLLGLHLYHGFWSMFQSVGFSHPRYTPMLQRFSKVLAVLITAGYVSIPVSVLAGWVS